MVQGRADCLLQRDGPESQPALPVIITKTCTVDLGSSRPLLGVSWDLTCVRHHPPTTFHHRYTPIRPPVKRRHCRAFDASLNAESRARSEKSGFSQEAEYLLISSELFKNLSLSRRSWFVLWADSPAVVHIKDAIKGFCAPVSFCACRMLHAKQWKCLPHYL